MTDPEQVVAEALHAESDHGKAGMPLTDDPTNARGICNCAYRATTAVAALKAAGALMPEEADEERRAISRYAQERNRTDALLQETLSVLGPLLEVPYGSHQAYLEGPTRIGELAHNRACDRLNEYRAVQERAASLAENIEQAIGGEG